MLNMLESINTSLADLANCLMQTDQYTQTQTHDICHLFVIFIFRIHHCIIIISATTPFPVRWGSCEVQHLNNVLQEVICVTTHNITDIKIMKTSCQQPQID